MSDEPTPTPPTPTKSGNIFRFTGDVPKASIYQTHAREEELQLDCLREAEIRRVRQNAGRSTKLTLYKRASYITDEKKVEFCELLATSGRPHEVAQTIGVAYQTVKNVMLRDKEFAWAVEEAMGVYKDSLAAEVHRRGALGWEEPIYYRGEVVGYVRKYDSTLLMAEARRHIPEYREQKSVNTTVDPASLQLGLRDLEPEDREVLREVLKEKLLAKDGPIVDATPDPAPIAKKSKSK